jgi:hypothetical protein
MAISPDDRCPSFGEAHHHIVGLGVNKVRLNAKVP